MFLFFVLFFSDQAYANDATTVKKASSKPTKGNPTKEVPTKIRSDVIDIKRKSQTVNFIGNVVIEKADSNLFSQKMTVLYEEKKDQKSGESQASQASQESSIKKIYTDEKVKIFGDDFVATGDSGYYDPKQDVFVLEKNVMVNNGISVARGDKFIYNITSKKSNFVSREEKSAEEDDKRVVVVIGDDVKDSKKSKEKRHD